MSCSVPSRVPANQHAQHQDPWTSSPKWNTAVINALALLRQAKMSFIGYHCLWLVFADDKMDMKREALTHCFSYGRADSDSFSSVVCSVCCWYNVTFGSVQNKLSSRFLYHMLSHHDCVCGFCCLLISFIQAVTYWFSIVSSVWNVDVMLKNL